MTTWLASFPAGSPIRRHSAITSAAVSRGAGESARAPFKFGGGAGQDAQAGFGRLGQPVLVLPPQQAEVEADRSGTAVTDNLERDLGGAAMHDGEGLRGGQDRAEGGRGAQGRR